MGIEFKNFELDNININQNFNANEIIGIIGDKAKSKIPLIIGGIDNNFNGEIIIGDYTIDKNVYPEILKKHIGLLFDNIFLYKKNGTVKKQLKKGLEFYIKVQDENKRMLDVLNLVGLDISYLHRKMNSLSLTEKKKVYLASILIFNPEIIILDRFENHFCYKDQKNIKDVLLELKRKYNKTIILISDNVSFLDSFVEKLYVIHNKKIKNIDVNNLHLKEISKYADIMPITDFCHTINDEKHPFIYYNSINELIKAVYRDVR